MRIMQHYKLSLRGYKTALKIMQFSVRSYASHQYFFMLPAVHRIVIFVALVQIWSVASRTGEWLHSESDSGT